MERKKKESDDCFSKHLFGHFIHTMTRFKINAESLSKNPPLPSAFMFCHFTGCVGPGRMPEGQSRRDNARREEDMSSDVKQYSTPY